MRQLLLVIIISCITQTAFADTPTSSGISPELLGQIVQIKSQNQRLQQQVLQLQSQVQTLQRNNQQDEMRLQRIEKWIIDRSKPGRILNP